MLNLLILTEAMPKAQRILTVINPNHIPGAVPMKVSVK